MFGAAQKNRWIGFAFLAVLFAYLLAESLSLTFFAVNMTVIILLSMVLKRLNCQALNGGAILFYSVIIDIVCFYFFPIFPIDISLGAYILAGLAFNLRAALPAIGLGFTLTAITLLLPLYHRKKLGAKNLKFTKTPLTLTSMK